jgi:hypothetical protein
MRFLLGVKKRRVWPLGEGHALRFLWGGLMTRQAARIAYGTMHVDERGRIIDTRT